MLYFSITLLILAVLAIPYCIRMNNQFYTSIIMEFGQFKREQGAGFYFVFPLFRAVEAVVDTRTITSTISSENALTKNGVPVSINLIFQWSVISPKKAILEVENYKDAIFNIAHTTLRENIGKHSLSALLESREKFNETLKKDLSEKTCEWGIEVKTVEILDIIVPDLIQNVMSQQEEATRRSEAQITLAENEQELAKINLETAKIYATDPSAWRIRQLDALITIAKSGKPIIIPTDISQAVSSATTAALSNTISDSQA